MRPHPISIRCAACNKPVDSFLYEHPDFDRNIIRWRVRCHGMEEVGAVTRTEMEQIRWIHNLDFFAGSDPPQGESAKGGELRDNPQ